jgi:phage terminase large subunit GpA-like protein
LGLTSEKKVLRYRKGRPYIEWIKRSSSIRNEALDCRVYATAALEIINPDLKKLAEQKAGVMEQKKPMTASRTRGRRVLSRGVR